MASANSVQTFVHKLEEGGWAGAIRAILLVTAILAVSLFLLFWRFKGLSSEEGMDQAQIAREIARGHGFSTKFIRPVQYAQFRANLGDFPAGDIPDAYHAPLNPALLSPFLWLARGTWDMDPESSSYIYVGDRIVAALGILFFALAVWVNYFTARRLFDHKLAVLGTGLTLICAVFWNIALAGLPQNLILLLFSGVTYCMVRAIEAHYAEKPPIVWMIASGVLFGLMLLANAVTLFVLFGAFVFAMLLFRPRGRDAAIMVVIALVMLAPWLIRNYSVSGSPLGIAAYSLLDGVRGSEDAVMRSFTTGTGGISTGAIKSKMQSQLGDQLGTLFEYLGRGIAPVFFLALLHMFKKPEAAMFRWALLLMWLSALGGMCLAGTSGTLSPNNLHVLFIPMMTFYALAFLLVLWNRIGLNIQLARIAFLSLLFGLSGLPLVALLMASGGAIQWPPYAPPYTAILNNWFGEDEIIASDQPWAVAWYGDRKSLWIPPTPKDFVDLSDFRRLHAPISALHLTPVTGDKRFMRDIVRGEWKDWAAFILRSPNLQSFPLQKATGVMGGEIFIIADTERWEGKMPEKGAMVEAEKEAQAKQEAAAPAEAAQTPAP